MRTITVSQPGGPEVLELGTAEIPQPRPGDVLVRVAAAGVGPWDTYLREGSVPVQMPFTPGGEFAGTVVGATGDDAAFEDGEPVYGTPGLTGCYAEYVTCPPEQLAPIPAGLDGVDAAAVPIDGLAAFQGLTDVLGIKAGDDVLITAGSGGLGHLAVQIARVLGANVIATASPRNHDFLHELGAAEVVDHTKPDWPDQVRALAGGGVDRVQVCARPTVSGAAQAASDGAVIATPVPADGEYPDADRLTWRHYTGQPSGSNLIRMAPWFDDGSLEVHIARRFFWTEVAAAHRDVADGHTRGKMVLVVDEDRAAQSGI
ncbi:MAG: NADP-dependent oxidoreductase [Actinobacteria bacterium]|nr:NADP-dependent oxidoreductase [Actinomycetota bacterium]MBO0836127.1 NADP-dependent oxidoreductase [Actinomycetota bacterium]